LLQSTSMLSHVECFIEMGAWRRVGAQSRWLRRARRLSPYFVAIRRYGPIPASPFGYIEWMKKPFVVATILLALMVPASAEHTDSANYFLPGCKGTLGRGPENTPEWRRVLCRAYINGLVYGAQGMGFCPPEGVSRGQAVAVIVKYIEGRPERMHEDFGKLALEAVTAAWPCKR